MHKPSMIIPASSRNAAFAVAIIIYLTVVAMLSLSYSPWPFVAIIPLGGVVFIHRVWSNELLPPYYIWVIILAVLIWPTYLLAAWLLSRVLTISGRPYHDCLASLPFIS
ncbi:MAG TPA: hypothetical protein VLF59_00035 [Candidatus Saccharimonadales bacterium]|nr:hypothetical protein [Candidatus Saccharimonadales bacterium]